MMQLFLVVLYSLIFIYIFKKHSFFKSKNLSWKFISSIFLIKIVFGYLLYLVYTYYYTDKINSDIYKYFDDSKIMFDAIYNKPLDYLKMLFGIGNDSDYYNNYYNEMNNWYRKYESNIYNDSHTIIRFNAFVRIFSFGYYHVHTVFMCFLSTIGMVGLFKSFEKLLSNKIMFLKAVVFLVPSVLFWASGVLKEGLVIFALGLLIYNLLNFLNKRFSISGIFVFMFCLLLLLHLKIYILVSLLPGILFLLMIRVTSKKYILFKFSISILTVLIIGLNIHHIYPSFNAYELLASKQNDFIGLSKYMESGSFINTNKLEPTFYSILINLPRALINSVFRPFPTDINSFFVLFSFIENLMILFLCFICLLYSKKENFKNEFFLFTLIYFIFLFIFIGLVTPVIGAIVRYKVPALSLMLISFLFVLDRTKLKKSKLYLKFLVK